ncbi:serine/threonine-protein kinase [Microlunatus ginsengisoli]|uniref:non-specific serine/threonine protein kinase n=1 Tax=Microlunatus ginsengisoli TaxID=363863 RepID=A0ABP6ZHF4_9ACTN
METIGRYRLVRRLGAGSFATVWLGHDDDLDVPVAVKVLAENWADNADVRNRFLGEARILRRIRDPRLVAVYDIGALPDGRPYFVMDFVNSGSLDDLRRSGVPPVVALRLCAQGCRAIDVLHANQVLHRDVTPGNLLIQRSAGAPPLVVLADLGVAKAMAEAGEVTMTAGTPAYMAPEQAAGGALDRRVDVYSLTAVTYAMLSGKPPFPVRTVADIIGRDPALDPPALAARVGAPASLDTVLAAGLAFRVDRRPPTALILADALDVVAAEMERTQGAADWSPPPSATSTMLSPAATSIRQPPPPVPTPPVRQAPAEPGFAPGPAVDAPVGSRPPLTSPASATPASSATAAPATAAPAPKGRSRAAFAALVAIACAALFALSLFVTILILER